ncbi:MAG: tetratricopeptide repeat protein [Pseudomonadota bacterium]
MGSGKCAECHREIYQRWAGSDHHWAMAKASAESVRGDFSNAKFEYFGFTSRFYKKGERFYVYTQGPGGVPDEFEIKYTFGWYPLQQYLVPFPGGKLQCLLIAWNVKDKRWYHLYPELPINPDDWLYWTNAGQNWNGMCAECHSTNLKKSYDPEKDAFGTSWSEISVGCEACHGAGGKHVDWAELPAMARPPVADFNLKVQTSDISSRNLVERCAPCHSRRATLGDSSHDEADLLDSMLPTLLEPDLYFPDGQIKGEVYVYGSFTQSKMYHRGIRCNDCHDVHSLKPVKEGNPLCLQCHRASEYDTPTHHFHKMKGTPGTPIRSEDGKVLFDVGTGAQCVACHMPGRTYMGIDYRLDHSLRRPRPDLTLSLGVPNACNRCHVDKTARWADDMITKWYGPGRRTHYGTLLADGRHRPPKNPDRLIRLAEDPLYPVIVRATAIADLGALPRQPGVPDLLHRCLSDDEALIRHTAVVALPEALSPQLLAEWLSPMLGDPVKGVRIEAARKLTGRPARYLEKTIQASLNAVLEEYEAAMRYAADFSYAPFNLGNLYGTLGRTDDAIREYQRAIAINKAFYPAKVNLAMTYNRLGKKELTLTLLKEVFDDNPTFYDIAFSLGLLLAEKMDYVNAVTFMEKAADGLPDQSRAQYNFALLLQKTGKMKAAESRFKAALAIDPENRDTLYALAVHYRMCNQLDQSVVFTRKLLTLYPGDGAGQRLLSTLLKD